MPVTFPKVVELIGRTATKLKAQRDYSCRECAEPVTQGSHFYSVMVWNSGLDARLYPTRLHCHCLAAYRARVEREQAAHDRAIEKFKEASKC
jgi:hypothetical protein